MLTLGDLVTGDKRATVNWADGDSGAKAPLAPYCRGLIPP